MPEEAKFWAILGFEFLGSGGPNSDHAGFNLAESHATSEDFLSQVQKLIAKLRRTQNLKLNNKWKVRYSILIQLRYNQDTIFGYHS